MCSLNTVHLKFIYAKKKRWQNGGTFAKKLKWFDGDVTIESKNNRLQMPKNNNFADDNK